MSPVRMLCLLLATSTAVVACGCFGGGGGGGGRTASRGGRFTMGRKQKEVASNDARGKKAQRQNIKASDTGPMSPEGSIQRDLALLKEREKSQEKVVKEMRAALNQGEGVVEKEELKLQEIRDQIARFDSAARQYEMASGRSRGNDARSQVVPASMYLDQPDPRDQRNFRADRGAPPNPYERSSVERASYRPDPRDGYDRGDDGYGRRDNPYSRNDSRQDSYGGREEVLYNPQAQRAEPPRGRAPDGFNENRYNDGPRQDQYGRPQASRNDGWEPSDRLFSSSNSNAPARPAAMVNTLNPERKRTAQVDRNDDRPAPAAGATTRPRAAQARPEPQSRDDEGTDEVFTPDLYLSGGR